MGKAWLNKLQSWKVCIFDQRKVETFRELHEAYAARQPPRLHPVEMNNVRQWLEAERAGLLARLRGSVTALAEFEDYCATVIACVRRADAKSTPRPSTVANARSQPVSKELRHTREAAARVLYLLAATSSHEDAMRNVRSVDWFTSTILRPRTYPSRWGQPRDVARLGLGVKVKAECPQCGVSGSAECDNLTGLLSSCTEQALFQTSLPRFGCQSCGHGYGRGEGICSCHFCVDARDEVRVAALDTLKTARSIRDRVTTALPALLAMCSMPDLRRMRDDFDRNRVLLAAQSHESFPAGADDNVYGIAWSRERCMAAIKNALGRGAVDYDEYENALRREVSDDDEFYYSGLLDVSLELGCHYVGVQPREEYESIVGDVASVAKAHLRSDGGWRYVPVGEVDDMIDELERDPSKLCVTESAVSFHNGNRHDFLLVSGMQRALTDALEYDDFVKQERWLNPYFFAGAHDDELHVTFGVTAHLDVAALSGDAAKVLYLVAREAVDPGGRQVLLRTKRLEGQSGISGQTFTKALAELFEGGWLHDVAG
ncbi:hypothetical protein DR64_263 [Paraburkholderia xenovorans LB400]|jgi:hypothetical protein|uniref:Uncharacterized protein n=2 Tax=Paraburkholderia xenovorans TaxID=36873 RepID=Q13ZT0_PARXL|nr:hypothetical protein Bxe_A2570 [Paraburkholderia xenovorans LB400]AIP33729.1 hypothetical protein DR64_263 [Paraburkholderia xenovorans LB400]